MFGVCLPQDQNPLASSFGCLVIKRINLFIYCCHSCGALQILSNVQCKESLK